MTQQACKNIVDRIVSKHSDLDNLQVGFLALTKDGRYGGYSVYNGFDYALNVGDRHEMVDAKYNRKWE